MENPIKMDDLGVNKKGQVLPFDFWLGMFLVDSPPPQPGAVGQTSGSISTMMELFNHGIHTKTRDGC